MYNDISVSRVSRGLVMDRSMEWWTVKGIKLFGLGSQVYTNSHPCMQGAYQHSILVFQACPPGE